MQRDSRRWKTRFGRWVGRFGVRQLVQQLGASGQPITEKAIYNWLAGKHVPRSDQVEAIERLSDGTIGFAQIREHQRRIGRSPAN